MDVAVRDTRGRAFGAYCSELRENPTRDNRHTHADSFYGTGECFLLAVGDEPLPPLPEASSPTAYHSAAAARPTVHLFPWTRDNRQFISFDGNSLVFGTGAAFGLVSAEALRYLHLEVLDEKSAVQVAKDESGTVNVNPATVAGAAAAVSIGGAMAVMA